MSILFRNKCIKLGSSVQSLSITTIPKRLNALKNNKPKFSYKDFTSKIVVLDDASDNLKQYYEKHWFYPVTRYPSEYYKIDKEYKNDISLKQNTLWKFLKYQYKKNKIIFKLLLTNYKNTAWYILNFRIKSSVYNKEHAGYDLDETLKNVTFKIIEEENQMSFVKQENPEAKFYNNNTVVDTMTAIMNEPTCILGSIDTSKFIPYHIDREYHSIVPHFIKISFLIALLEELSLVLFKFNLVKPPFFAHLPETLEKQIDSENFMLYEKVLKGKSKKEFYLTPERFQEKKEFKVYHKIMTTEYMNFIYLDDLCFIKKMVQAKSRGPTLVYKEELVYKCLERNLFPDNYTRGTYLNLSSKVLLEMYTEYLDSRYTQTLLHSANGIHNIYDLSR